MTAVVPEDTSVGGAIDELAAQLEPWHVPGMEVVVVRDGEVCWCGGVGVRSVADQAPVTARTLFHHGSCGKASTALVASTLAEHGLVVLDAPVRRVIPQVRLPDEVVAARMTMRDLLSHRSGLGRHDLAWIFNPFASAEDLLARLEHLPLAGDLRAQWSYSNLGYALAGVVVATVTSTSWHEQLQSLVLDPLGMSRSLVVPAAAIADPDCATPHRRAGDQTVETAWRAGDVTAPAGGVITCAEDTARWLLHQLEDGAAVAATHRPAMTVPPEASPYPELRFHNYALGWVLGTFRGRPIVWHNGGVDGFSAETLLFPEQRLGIALCANLHPTRLPFAGLLSLADRMLGESSDPSWYDRLAPDAPPTPAPADEPVAAPPSHPLSAYAGTFSHPGYGQLTVAIEGERLVVRIGTRELATSHRHYATWNLRYEPLDVDASLTFVTDAEGRIAEAVAAFDAEPTQVRFGAKGDG